MITEKKFGRGMFYSKWSTIKEITIWTPSNFAASTVTLKKVFFHIVMPPEF